MLHRVILSVLVAASFGAAVPAAGVSLPVVPQDVEVGGVAVGGLISIQARDKIQRKYGQPIRIFLGDESWSVRPARLGAKASLDRALDRALRAKPGAGIELDMRVRQQAVRRFVRRLNRKVAVPATEAKLVGLRNLAPAFTEAKPGRRVNEPAMVRGITRMITSGYRGDLQLKMVAVEPEVTADDFGSIIVIRRGSNRLHLYDGARPVRTFAVATGTAEYPTPVGDFEIVVKERDPTWNPPDSDWAAGLGPVPPGPSNPLGTRWIGLSAPGIGIHGTPQPWTIGTAASHGCIRMYIRQVEWLFERVHIGTPVFIVRA
jgi:lipoprotein-anchoring transpeptidase ErfK/SrfK